MSKYPIDVNEETFENVTVFDHPMLFTCLRCDRSTLPKGMYLYEVQHNNDGTGEPCEIAERILVNHLGTLITNCPIELEQPIEVWKPFRLMTEDDWNFEGTESTLKEYMAQNPQKKEKSYER